GEHGERLHRRVFDRRPVEGIFLRLARLGRADGKRHETAFRELVGEIALWLAVDASGGFGFVENREDGGAGPFLGGVGDEEVARGLLLRRPEEADAVTDEVLQLRRFERL